MQRRGFLRFLGVFAAAPAIACDASLPRSSAPAISGLVLVQEEIADSRWFPGCYVVRQLWRCGDGVAMAAFEISHDARSNRFIFNRAREEARLMVIRFFAKSGAEDAVVVKVKGVPV